MFFNLRMQHLLSIIKKKECCYFCFIFEFQYNTCANVYILWTSNALAPVYSAFPDTPCQLLCHSTQPVPQISVFHIYRCLHVLHQRPWTLILTYFELSQVWIKKVSFKSLKIVSHQKVIFKMTRSPGFFMFPLSCHPDSEQENNSNQLVNNHFKGR